jgi:Zn-dependent protease
MITFLVVLVGWIFSLCLHEFSHALVAYYGGDTSVRDKGYLTFNPLKYTHPLYSIVLPLLFLVMGGIVAFIVLSVLLPVFSIYSAVDVSK